MSNPIFEGIVALLKSTDPVRTLIVVNPFEMTLSLVRTTLSLSSAVSGELAALASKIKLRGSTPILRTLQRSLIMGKRSVYVEEKKVQPPVQARCG